MNRIKRNKWKKNKKYIDLKEFLEYFICLTHINSIEKAGEWRCNFSKISFKSAIFKILIFFKYNQRLNNIWTESQ